MTTTRRALGAVAAAVLLTALSGAPVLAQDGPRVTVTPSTGLAADGSTEITISGTGFAPDGNGGLGYGLRGGPELATLKDPATTHGFQLAKLIKKGAVGAQIPLTDAGTWEFKTSLKAVYAGSDGQTHDAAKTPFRIHTFGWKSAETTWDTATPISFAGTTPDPPSGTGLSWGVKQSWRSYVATFGGTATGSGGVVMDPAYTWPVSGVDADGTVRFGGAVHYSVPSHLIWDIGIAEPRIVPTGAGTATLHAKVNFSLQGTKEVPQLSQPPTDTALADLTLGTPRPDGDKVTTDITAAVLTEAGAAAFAGFYQPGTALDTGSFTHVGRTTPPAYQPKLALGAASVVKGGTLAVTGSGFAPDEDVTLTGVAGTARTDAAGAFSTSPVVDLEPGEHTVTATGAVSKTPATATVTVTAPPSSEPCAINGEVTRGNLLWGFKKSFRQYVGTGLTGGPATGNSITAADGAEITNVDEVVGGGRPNPDGIPTGAYQFGFSSATYASPTDLTGQFAGSIRFSYPAHLFTLTLARPKVVLTGDGGTLYADVKLESTPGAPSEPKELTGVALATLDSSGATRTSEDGVVVVSGVKATLTSSEAFAGFYETGAALDDVTVTLGASCATLPEGGGTPPPPGGQGGGDGENLVPALQYRPLASTGATLTPLYAGAGFLVGGAVLLFLARRRHARV
ncbi:HtaA domain-containing protein [Umezawaea endophytica]|uniref:HtaA domain-containing protein n=1 Tax=Umezawaea endophytica TaxID=1654476 RepID=A0A9X2VEU5_9PSEU|nr:HtaA domain-containing protein [Umezawaea endophytica]MCS7475341.1 HtaA domain-containing protein [Umezawaea endophytica]